MSIIYKILSTADWARAQEAGVFIGAGIDLFDGYIHFSTADTVVETVALHFAGRGDLVLVEVDAEKLTGDLVYEPSRGGKLFPHLYGPMELDAVVQARPLPLGADGRHVFPTAI